MLRFESKIIVNRKNMSKTSAMTILGITLAAGLPGCREEEPIVRYTVSKTAKIAAPAERRLLAAIFPRNEDTWFLKFTGTSAGIEANAANFRDFVHSVRFTGKDSPPIEWTIPAEWRKGPVSPSRYATFFAGPDDTAPELSVTKLGKNAGSLLANVNRWRDQMGLIGLTIFELGTVSKPFSVNGVNGTWVDMAAAEK